MCSIYGCEPNTYYAIKLIMKQRSFELITIATLYTLLILSYCLRLFEQKTWPVEFHNITVAMWNVLITMTGIGYGDYYPKSHCGRVVGLITSFWGVLDTSLFILACDNIFMLNSSEKKAFTLL